MDTPASPDRTRRDARRRGRRAMRAGFALESVMLAMVLFAVVVLAGLTTVSTISRTAAADYQTARATYAAEGASDALMSQLDAAMQDGRVSAEDLAGLQVPSVPGYTITQSVVSKGDAKLRTVATGPYAGLFSMNQPFDITVSARDSSGALASAVIAVNAMSIPIFQFAVFYDQDLEFHPGPQMTFAGRVHTNGNLYTINNVTLSGIVTTPESTFLAAKHKEGTTNGVYIKDGEGKAVKMDKDSRSVGGDAAYRNWSEDRFDSRLMSRAHGVQPLRLPLPGNTPPFTLLLPRGSTDSEAEKKVKMAWKADWLVTVRAGVFAMADTTAMKAAFCDSLTQLRPDGLEVPTGADCRRIFKPRVNAFRDNRQGLMPDLIDIHMDSLRIWSDAKPGTRAPSVLYVQFASVPTGTVGDLPAVRVRQASQLPVPRTAGYNGLTVATERPVYVLGDFNTVNWRPAALMGDVVVTLSTPPNAAMSAATTVPSAQRCGVSGVAGWCDNQQQTAVVRGATTTTINAAVLSGHTPTTCDGARAGCPSPVMGGGVHNMMGYRENWSGRQHVYTGSIVSLFACRYITAPHSGAYYNPPERVWAFDRRFEDPSKLPPGTPAVGSVMQTAFRPIY